MPANSWGKLVPTEALSDWDQIVAITRDTPREEVIELLRECIVELMQSEEFQNVYSGIMVASEAHKDIEPGFSFVNSDRTVQFNMSLTELDGEGNEVVR